MIIATSLVSGSKSNARSQRPSALANTQKRHANLFLLTNDVKRADGRTMTKGSLIRMTDTGLLRVSWTGS
jgi:hypothetical protein